MELVDDVGERIEIELVPNDERGRSPRGRERPPTSAAAGPRSAWPRFVARTGAGADARGRHSDVEDDRNDRHDDNQDAVARERMRLLAWAGGVGVVAVVVGWAVGRGSAPSATDAVPATTAPVAVTGPAVTTVVPVDTIRPVDGTTTIVDRPARPVVRLPDADDLVPRGAVISEEPISVDPRLAGVALSIVGLSSGGTNLVELDLSAGVATTYQLGGLPTRYSGQPVVGDDWVVLPTSNSFDAFVVHDDGRVDRSRLQPDGHVFNIPGTGLFWRAPLFAPDGSLTLNQVDLAGEPTGVTVTLPPYVWPASVDPSGGIVVESSGRWFVLDGQRVEAFGVGDLLGLDERAAYLFDCPALDACGLYRYDRASGESVRTPVEFAGDASWLAPTWWNTDASSAVSPDGRLLAVNLVTSAGRTSFVVVDVATGEMIETDLIPPGPSRFAWSDDGRFVVFVAGVVPHAYEVATGETFRVLNHSLVLGWQNIARRP